MNEQLKEWKDVSLLSSDFWPTVQSHRHLGKHRPLGGVFHYLLFPVAPHPSGSWHVRRGKHMHAIMFIYTHTHIQQQAESLAATLSSTERNCRYNSLSQADLQCLIFIFYRDAVGKFTVQFDTRLCKESQRSVNCQTSGLCCIMT